MIPSLLASLLTVFATAVAFADDTLLLKGASGPGHGKRIVIVTGDEEYRSEESGPMLAKILSQRHGFECTVIFSWTDDFIDPNNQSGLRGLQALESADLMIVLTRFRQPSEEEAAHVTRFLNAGKPVIGLRTATHAFTGRAKFGDGDSAIAFGDFGMRVLGERWVRHHGGHKRQGCRGVPETANGDHPILRGATDLFAPSDVYGVEHLTEADTILLRGAVTESLAPDSPILTGKLNDPMQPLAWLHRYTAPDGKTTGESFCTTAGASVDFVSEGLRRLVVNACYHLTGLDVPAKANVDFVDPFYPSFYGFIQKEGWYEKASRRPEDLALGKSPFSEDPPGSPDWPFRATPPGVQPSGSGKEAARGDAPWSRMDYGPFLSTPVGRGEGVPPVNKGLVVALRTPAGKESGLSAVFDTDLLSWRCVWEGELELRGIVFDGPHGTFPRIEGEPCFRAPLPAGVRPGTQQGVRNTDPRDEPAMQIDVTWSIRDAEG